MTVIKRDGTEVPFDREKIAAAVRKANQSVPEAQRFSDDTPESIARVVEVIAKSAGRPLRVEEIQD
ncbi:MAG: hypothetical protein J6X53_10360, partial [Abditibacteriota bacterium]|nr:hypothetical protein [Abditibacteriota bacterium]